MTAPGVTATCSWTVGSWLLGWEKCAEPSTEEVVTGCVHEHVYASPSCASCAEVVRRDLRDGMMMCTPCRDAGAPETRLALLEGRRP